jgi:hypothetical protein
MSLKIKKNKVKTWKEVAKDRRTWRDLAEKAKTGRKQLRTEELGET